MGNGDVILSRCKNSMSGEHEKAERIGKDKNKPDICKYCGFLWCDLYFKRDDSVSVKG